MTTEPVSSQAATNLRPEWPQLVGDSLKQYGAWHTYKKLLEAKKTYPADLRLRGYIEIIRNQIVREFLSHPKGLNAVPRLTADFLTNFDQYNLTAQEGYLISLIDGRLDIQKLLKLSPLDALATIFALANLLNETAISVP